MSFLRKLFGGKDRLPPPPSHTPSAFAPATPNPVEAPNSPFRPVEGMDRVSAALLIAKRPRHAHLAKHHQLAGEFAEAEIHYAVLADMQQRVFGNDNADLAAVLFEIAALNHHNEFKHDPQTQVIFDSFGRGDLSGMFYRMALAIHRAATQRDDAGYAQSLYGLATHALDSGDRAGRAQAKEQLVEAARLQFQLLDALPLAETLARLAELDAMESGDPTQLGMLMADAIAATDRARIALAEFETGQHLIAGAADAHVKIEQVNHASDHRKDFADPYYRFLFEQLSTGPIELLAMALDLHIQEYERDLCRTRSALLENLAALWKKQGNDEGAKDLLIAAQALCQMGVAVWAPKQAEPPVGRPTPDRPAPLIS
jgi:hypothetical protein